MLGGYFHADKRRNARLSGSHHGAADREQVEAAHYPQSAGPSLAVNELKKSLEGISQKSLTDSLRSLEEDGLIIRTVYPEVPPRVEYSLSELGETMRPILDAMETWGLSYQEQVNAK